MKKINYIVELLILLLFIVFSNYVHLSIIDFATLFVFVVLAHIFKMIRLYLVFLDYKLPITDFVLTYIRGTAFSIITPFKLGELYKWRLFAKEINSGTKSFILIVIDRFFDTMILAILLLPYIVNGPGTVVSILSIVVVVGLIIAYLIFDESYKYLNNFLVFNSKSDRGVRALDKLEKLNDTYKYIDNIIFGKKTLMIVTSLVAWGFEVLAYMVFCNKIGVKFIYNEFVENLNADFLSVSKNDYLIYCTICLFVLYLIVLGRKLYEGRNSSSR